MPESSQWEPSCRRRARYPDFLGTAAGEFRPGRPSSGQRGDSRCAWLCVQPCCRGDRGRETSSAQTILPRLLYVVLVERRSVESLVIEPASVSQPRYRVKDGNKLVPASGTGSSGRPRHARQCFRGFSVNAAGCRRSTCTYREVWVHPSRFPEIRPRPNSTPRQNRAPPRFRSRPQNYLPLNRAVLHQTPPFCRRRGSGGGLKGGAVSLPSFRRRVPENYPQIDGVVSAGSDQVRDTRVHGSVVQVI